MNIKIDKHEIGTSCPVFIIAELSANHVQDFNLAVKTIEAAKRAGADAIKTQTYTADTITIDSNYEYFHIKHGTLWDGETLYQLYQRAYTPWEWQPKLKEVANELGLCFFSTPFDDSAVDFLEELNIPAYKIASPELVDIPLIRRIASTGKPVIMSTGMGTLDEINEAICAIRESGNDQIVLLKCTSAYPAPAEEMNLNTIPHLAKTFHVPVGLSDHTIGIDVPIAAVALGACIVEKHFILSHSIKGPDNAFSMEPREFKIMVDSIRTVENALGEVSYKVTKREKANHVFRRSLFVVSDIHAGEVFTKGNIRSIRPGHGLHTRFLEDVLGKRSAKDIKKGTPLSWDLIVSNDK